MIRTATGETPAAPPTPPPLPAPLSAALPSPAPAPKPRPTLVIVIITLSPTSMGSEITFFVEIALSSSSTIVLISWSRLLIFSTVIFARYLLKRETFPVIGNHAISGFAPSAELLSCAHVSLRSTYLRGRRCPSCLPGCGGGPADDGAVSPPS